MEKRLKLGVVGCGQRGYGLMYSILNIKEVKVVAICDNYPERTERIAKRVVEEAGDESPFQTTDYLELLKQDVDAVIVSTNWANHVVVALACMEAGIPVGMEVGGTHSIEDCWKLVECYERTKTPFFFMENCCFYKDEALATSLVRNGKLGEISYCQGSYCHDLREEITAVGLEANHYRLKEYTEHNCENYPTHELGPIAKILNVNSGNRFVKLVSMSSKAQGLEKYVNDNADRFKPLIGRKFAQGDVVTTMIQCENGETILLKLDTTLPRPYDRNVTVSGTEGFYCQTTNAVVTKGDGFQEWMPYKDIFNSGDKYKDYLPEDWKNISQEQIDAGHGGMDYVMLKHFFKAVMNKEEMPIDVYDAVSWMSITALSEQSIANGSVPVEIPDFTRGKYKTRKTVDVFEYPIVKEQTQVKEEK